VCCGGVRGRRGARPDAVDRLTKAKKKREMLAGRRKQSRNKYLGKKVGKTGDDGGARGGGRCLRLNEPARTCKRGKISWLYSIIESLL